ncbi:uncharacterized protein LOC143848038 isoform X2 [Tasmannia lanceolata]
MRGKRPRKNENHVDKEGRMTTKCGDNQLSQDFVLGDIVWVRIHNCSWWPAQVVDENTLSGSNKINKKIDGEVLARLYGSYEYLYVDPMKYRSEFENTLQENNDNVRELFQKALEQDISQIKSSAKLKRKASGPEEIARGEASRDKKPKQDRIKKTQEATGSLRKPLDSIARGTRTKQCRLVAEKTRDQSREVKKSKPDGIEKNQKADTCNSDFHWKFQLKPKHFFNEKKAKRQISPSWSPLPEWWLKLNFDGSAMGNPGRAGFGGVIRDHNGNIIIAYYGSAGVCDANEAEVMGLLNGLRWFHSNNLRPLLGEGDSSNTIAWAKGLNGGPWRLANKIDEIRDLVCVIRPQLVHRRRSANNVVDMLAKKGVDGGDVIFGGRELLDSSVTI